MKGSNWLSCAVAALLAAGWALSALILLASPPSSAPLLLFAFYTSHAAILLASVSLPFFDLHLLPFPLPLPFAIAQMSTLVLCLGLVASYPLASTATQSSDDVPPLTTEETPAPISMEDEGSIRLGAWLTLSWVKPLLSTASARPLNYEAVWSLPRSLKSEAVRRSSAEKGGRRLVDRLLNNNRRDLACCLALGVISSLLAYLSPLFLQLILTRFGSSAPKARAQAYILTLIAFLVQLLRATVDLQKSWHERQVIVKVRSSIISEVYVKGLKRMDASGSVEKEAGSGKKSKGGQKDKGDKGGPASLGRIVSMMNTDANKIANMLPTLISLAAAPFEIVVAIVLLYRLLGWPALAGVAVMSISIPLNQLLVRRRMKLHPHVLGSRDTRMTVVGEFISAIRFVKYSAAEEQWLARVDAAREEELKWLFRTRANYMLMHCLWFITPDVILLVTFACLTKVVGAELDLATAFASLGLFTLIRAPMAQLPTSLSMIAQTTITLQRLEDFFAEPDVAARVSSLHPDHSPSRSSSATSPVSIQGATFRYKGRAVSPRDEAATTPSETTPLIQASVAPPAQIDFTLRDITVDFPIGELTLIAGPTASGKSSLLLALLGEMYQEGGTVQLRKGTLATDFDAETGLYDGVTYSSQMPWLQHLTIRQNIIFGTPFEEDRYARVIEACALEADLAMFEAGDETEIGEKGISLSGGQKARVALARAVYSRAKTVLLDDPLSAVDSHTAHHLVKKCLQGPLFKHRTVILVTHHISLCLPGAAYLVRLHSGRVVAQDFVSNLEPAEIDEDLRLEAEEEPRISSKEEEKSPLFLKPDKAKGAGKLVLEEKREIGRVKTQVYSLYLKAAGYDTWTVLVVLVILGRLSRVLDRVFFKVWAESYRPTPSLIRLQWQQLASPPLLGLPSLPSASDNVDFYLLSYAIIAVVSTLITLASILSGFRGSLNASRTLFRATTRRIANAPFRYFDTTPTGRLMSRFTGDFQTVDAAVTDQIRVTITYFSFAVISLAVICFISPSFIFFAVLVTYLYVRLSLVYVKCSRDLRRLESNARSPIFSKFGETLHGIVTCRAFGAERRLLSELASRVDQFLSVNYAGTLINRWLIWRFDVLGGFAVAVTTFLALFGHASPGLAALAITSAQTFVQKLYDLCRIVSSLEVDLNSVERVSKLLDIVQEPPSIIEGKRPPAHWPSRTGGIRLEGVEIRYDADLPAVIKGLSVTFAAGQKIGLVGRTGSGKSTLALALLRFTDPSSGRIILDGIDITTIGTRDLRSRLTYIAQESVLFSGTIRSNLDPFDENSDEECTRVLAQVHLNSNDDSTGRLGVKLDSLVAAGGFNFSAGQRQLLAMARALLKQSNVIIMDEATSGVDRETDAKIQEAIRHAFQDRLVITIAHRLSTIIDYDMVLVLEQGELVEYDSPAKLMQRDSAFRRLCEQAADWAELKERMGI